DGHHLLGAELALHGARRRPPRRAHRLAKARQRAMGGRAPAYEHDCLVRRVDTTGSRDHSVAIRPSTKTGGEVDGLSKLCRAKIFNPTRIRIWEQVVRESPGVYPSVDCN